MERKPPVKISILEKDESEVSHCWKFCQLFSYVIVVISSIATTLAMGNVLRMFNDECLLYADLPLTTVNNWTIVVVPHSAGQWGKISHCNFCQYCPVASALFAAIWATIFVMCGRGGASRSSLPQPWRIIPPALLFNFVFLVLSSISVVLTCGGFSAFCDSIAPQLNVRSCEDVIGFLWERFPSADNFYDDLVIAQIGSSVTLIGWALGFVILIIRVITHADFRIIGIEKKHSTESSMNAFDECPDELSSSSSLTPRRSSEINGFVSNSR